MDTTKSKFEIEYEKISLFKKEQLFNKVNNITNILKKIDDTNSVERSENNGK